MEQDYRTILEDCEIEIEIKKSRLIGRVYPVADEAAVEEIISRVKKEHYKATHVCSAYVLHTLPERQKANDDGEPSGTAGRPILEVIHKRELKNILVLVIRYFGGIKLGAGGLIRAYSGCAAEVIAHSPIIKKQFSDCLSLEIDYPQYGGLLNKLTEWGYTPIAEDFGEKVTLDFYLPVAETEGFISMIRDATNDRFDYAVLEQRFVDVVEKA